MYTFVLGVCGVGGVGMFLEVGPQTNFHLRLGVCGVGDCSYWLPGFARYSYPIALRYVHNCIGGMRGTRGRHVSGRGHN